MTITFYSNYLNDHQLPFCEELIKYIGYENFHFVASREIDSDRIEMGFENMNVTKSFVVRAYENNTQFCFAQQLMIESDIVIIGSSKGMPFEKRMSLNKLTFRYSERILKRGDIHLFDPRLIKQIYKNWTKYRCRNLYTLCASAYTARDLSLFGFPKSRCYKWGYFPKMKKYESYSDILKLKELGLKHQDVSILWVGRLIGWKHPEYPILIADMLRRDGYSFNLRIIGSGTLKSYLADLIKKYHLDNNVSLVGALTPDEVRYEMEKAEIFLFTSDKNEGWGAVLNESMNSGCAVVANRAIGSVPFLIEDRKNGLIYEGSVKDAYLCVKRLFEDSQLRETISINAYNSICNYWNAENAVANFLGLIENIQKNKTTTNSYGPCSIII